MAAEILQRDSSSFVKHRSYKFNPEKAYAAQGFIKEHNGLETKPFTRLARMLTEV